MLLGIWTPLVTPFHHGQADTAALRQPVRHCEGTGVSGFVALGTTGEAMLLSQIECCTVLETITDTCGERAPSLTGVGATDMRDVCAQIRRYKRWNSTGYLAPPPYYVCPSQAGLYWHYAHVAASTTRPVMLYNVSKHTGVSIMPGTALVLAEQPNIIAIKECVAGHFGVLQDGPLDVLSGDDSTLLDCPVRGSTGGILAGAHLRPELFVALVAHHRAGRIDEAKRLVDVLVLLAALLFTGLNLTPAKALLSAEGRIGPDTCVPILPASGSLHRRLLAMTRALEDVEADCRLRLAQLQGGRIRCPYTRLR